MDLLAHEDMLTRTRSTEGDLMERVLLIWWSASSAENIAFGLATRTWGLKSEPRNVRDGTIDYVLFGRALDGPAGSASVRVSLADWQASSCELTLAQASGGIYTGTAPHWPDESPGNVLYPHRLGFITLGTLAHQPLDAADVITPTTVELMRQVAITSRTSIVDMDVAGLLKQLGVDTEQATGDPILPTRADDDGDASPTNSGAGRTTDVHLRKAVEAYSVRLAKKHMKDLGWSHVEELGKPFDLVCKKADGSEKHVEVKGSTGAAFEVEYTSNEVDHFRRCPFGADLIVVRDIIVDEPSYECSGGTLLHVDSYEAPGADLQVTRYRGRVPGW